MQLTDNPTKLGKDDRAFAARGFFSVTSGMFLVPLSSFEAQTVCGVGLFLPMSGVEGTASIGDDSAYHK